MTNSVPHANRFQAAAYRPYHVSAGCIIVDSLVGRSKVLVLFGEDGWSSLPKGTLENNETLEICAVRETKEETGLTVELVDYIGGDSYEVNIENYNQPIKKITHYFLAKPKSGNLQPGDQYARIEWSRFNDLIKMVDDKRRGKSSGELLRHAQSLIQQGIYA